MQGAEGQRSVGGLKGDWEVRAQIQPSLMSPQALPGDLQENIAVVWSVQPELTVIPLSGHFQRHLRTRSLVPLCLGWAVDSLVKGYLVAQHEVGFFEMLRKEGNLPS